MRRYKAYSRDEIVSIAKKVEMSIDEICGAIQGSSQSVSPVFAYLNQEDNCLLLMHPEATNHYFLLTRQPVPYSFAQEMEGKTGLLFYLRNGNGKDKVLTRHQEMREQGLFRPS